MSALHFETETFVTFDEETLTCSRCDWTDTAQTKDSAGRTVTDRVATARVAAAHLKKAHGAHTCDSHWSTAGTRWTAWTSGDNLQGNADDQ